MLVAGAAFGASAPAAAAPAPAIAPVAPPLAVSVADAEPTVLVFSKTAGFRHGSIPAGVAAVKALGAENGFSVDVSEDGADFTTENLAKYDAVVWMSTTGDVLTEEQQLAFQEYIQGGGGYAGVHAASDTEYDWSWYGGLVGAYFSGHPADQNATITVEDHAHPSSEHLGDTWDRYDEWYNFRTNPRDKVHVLMSLDESSYTGGTMGIDHPTAWCQNYDGGRSWYTGGGHTDASYSDPAFLKHLLGGIETAAGLVDSDCSASQSGSYELVPLDTNTGNPMALAIADDSTVFYAERNGRVQRIDAASQQTTTALTLPVTQANEDGLLGIALDPDFGDNGWVYLYWAPANVGSDGPHNRVSRFTYDAAAKTFDPATEADLLKVTTQRNTCCHAGGDMLFDNDGNLVLALGDNTNPFESDGYAPIDERAGRQDYDAQRTSANTNDLRGKVLKITPTDDGSYTIPEGNLFPESADTASKTRPEIFAMGFRNPFRIGLDPYTNNLLVADYGPDAGSANPNRGPGGTVEWGILEQPGNYGWPYCVGITCYKDYNFSTNTSGPAFNPDAPINNSPNNTGLTNLPPVIQPAWWTENGAKPIYQEIGNSGAPMGGPVYQYDPENPSDTKWPEYWDGKALFAEWNTGRMFTFQLNEETSDTAAKHSQIVDVQRMLPGIFDPSKGFNKSMDFEFGPDGALYVVDWGSEFGGNTADSGVYRVDYVQADPSPIARASADVTDGPGPSLGVQFSSAGTRHPNSKPYSIEWDFGDGTPTTDIANPAHTYTANGDYTARLTVTDEDGKVAIANVRIIVGNTRPTVTIDFPENGGFFTWGDDVAYTVTVTDPDGSSPIDCEGVTLIPALGHDSHNHDFGEIHGCEGSFPTARDAGHGLEANLFWVVNANYTDDGGAVGVPLTGYATTVLNSTHMEAEYFDTTGRIGGTGGPDDGVKVETTSDTAGGGRNLGFIDPGDWWSYSPINLKGMDAVSLRIAKGFDGPGRIEARWNDPENGQLLGEVEFRPTLKNGAADWQTYSDFLMEFDKPLPTETGTVFFVLTAGGANVNYLNWVGDGVDSNSPPVAKLNVSASSGTAPLVVDASVDASDPEGAAISYSWNTGLGTGFTPGEASQQIIYTEPGSYELRVRVADEQGAYTEVRKTITVSTAGSAMCLNGRSDGFDDRTLDTSRWNRTVRPNQDARVANGSLVIPASKTDIYGGGGDVSNIVLQDLPSGAWQATAKVTFEARSQYQQAGLIVYGDDDNYAKFVIQGRSGTSNASDRVFQFIREEAGSPNEVAASNTANLGAEFPDTFFVRMTSDGTTLNASYSADGQQYTAMPETKALAGIVSPRIGMTAFANPGSPAAVIDAKFDWFHITPDNTAVAATPNDEFDGSSLDVCRWAVVNEEPTGYRVADGRLNIDTSPTDIYGGDRGVPNFIVQAQPTGDEWVVETKVDASKLDRSYQQAGLILYGGDDDYVKLDIVATNSAGSAITRNIELRNEIGGVVQNPQPNAPAPGNGQVWLRLAKSGNTYTGWSSNDGVIWTQITETVQNAGLGGARIGLYALGNAAQGQVSNTAGFEYFHVVGADQPQTPVTVSATVDPAAANGAAGWYTQAVTVSVATAGGGTSTVYREVNVDGAGWLEYTTPVVVTTDGTHTVQYRASAPGQTTAVGEVSFKLDRTAPAAAAELVVAEDGSRSIVVTTTDATSGPGASEVRVGDGEWTAYTGPVALDETAQTVSYRATDVAGNRSGEGTIQVPAAPAEPGTPTISVQAVVDPASPDGLAGWYVNAVTVTATGTTTETDGVVTTEYSTDGTVFATMPEALVIDADGTTTLWIRAVDGEGRLSPTLQREVRIDRTAPTAAATADARAVTFTAEDGASGIDRVEYRFAGDAADVWRTYTDTFTVAGNAAETVTYRAVDVAGNTGSSAALELAAIEEPEPVPTIVVDAGTIVQGGLVQVTGTGFTPGAELSVWLYSDPAQLSAVTVGEDGGFALSVRIPVGTTPGEHHIVIRDGETVLAQSAAITITAAAVDPGPGTGGPGTSNGSTGGNGSGGLAVTGFGDADILLPLVTLLLLLGAAGMVFGRRRTTGAEVTTE